MPDIKHYTLWDGRKMADLPRPGRLEVITWQLNVTAYPPSGVLRVTSTLADPTDQVTLHKAKFEAPEFIAGSQAVDQQIQETWRAIQYLDARLRGH